MADDERLNVAVDLYFDHRMNHNSIAGADPECPYCESWREFEDHHDRDEVDDLVYYRKGD